jgi:uncharacterized protein (TIGR02284 family)
MTLLEGALSMNHDKTIDILNDLIETCKDGEQGFRASAEPMRNASIRESFLARADECQRSAQELQACVRQLGGDPEEGGTTTEALHRGWTSLKGSLGGNSDLALLEETERGEDVAMERYRDALQDDDLAADVRPIVERQYEGVKRNHAQIRALRDEARRTQSA